MMTCEICNYVWCWICGYEETACSIGLQDKHIYARILIMEYLGLTNKTEIEFKDFF